ncbi:MAG: CinA family protein [Rhodospirillales bacterium]|jgi:nicotinamide-nucleotide amidase
MPLNEEECTKLAQQLLSACEAAQLKFATAESCTGGLIAAYLTEIAGSSAVVERGFVTYSNEAKNEMLGVPMNMIIHHGAVSEEVARAMAEGAVKNSNADLAVSVTGIAGPGGGTADKPVGRVHMAVAQQGKDTIHAVHTFEGNRFEVRQQTVAAALRLSLKAL